MPWARFETEFVRHEKVQAIPAGERPCAIALYFAAVSYCAEMLTDGLVTRSVMAGLTEEVAVRRPRKVIEQLVRVGLLDRVATGYQVHDYLEYQSSRQEVLERRAYEAEKKRRARGQKKLPLADVPGDVPGGQGQGQEQNVPGGQAWGLARATRGRAEAEAEVDQDQSVSSGQDLDVAKGQRSAAEAEVESLPFELELAKSRLVRAAPGLDVERLERFGLPLAAWVAAREEVEARGKAVNDRAAYVASLFRDWSAEGRYVSSSAPFVGREP
jgi:hypothetical protein